MDFDIHIVAVVAPGFVTVNITFHNTVGASKHQAVVVRKIHNIYFLLRNMNLQA